MIDTYRMRELIFSVNKYSGGKQAMVEKPVEIASTQPIKALYANPAAVGLAGFGATTLLLQFSNLGLLGTSAVMWLAFFFGGLAQLVAGFQEFKTGNNFGFAAFSTYGAFWLARGGMYLSNTLGFTRISAVEVGWFYVVFTILTFIYFIGSMKQNGALAFVFLTLLLGFILLDIGHITGTGIFDTLGAIDLIICALSALYLMAHVALTPLKIRVPVGGPWLK
jgi:uncharacterized protein